MRGVRSVLVLAIGLCMANVGHAQQAKIRTIHVFVALADNDHQGIIPVARILGNGKTRSTTSTGDPRSG